VQPVSGARGLLTTTNADGTISKGGNYDNFNQFNPGKLTAAEAANKQASVRLLSTPGISTPAEAAAIKNSKEFKSTTAGQNSASGSGTETGAAPADTGNPIGGTKTKEFGSFVYPEGLGNTKQDVVKFSMLQYSPSGLRGGERTKPESRTIGTVVLPIPNGISDTNSVDWGQNSLNAVEAAAAAAAFTSITEGLGKGIKEAGDSFKEFLGEGETKTGVAALFTSAAVGTAGAQVLARTSGSVINPNMELLFNGPQLRPFQFTFKLSARSEGESKQIIKILNFFKRGMSAIKTESNLFLKAPNTFKIQYLHLGQNGQDHPYIGRIKECALQSVTTSYTPEGQYATFSDGVMVSYQLTMQFQELEPIFNNDYAGIDGIGY
jgi:hypothetical protein